MKVKKLKELHSARPFQRFNIYMADGRKVAVTHPEWMSLSPSGRLAQVFYPDDSSEFIDVLLVTSVEVKANGKHKLPRGRARKK